MKFIKLKASTCASLLSLASAASLLAVPSDTVVVQWNDAALQAIRITHPGPPIVARALAITNTCMYDAWAPYDEHALGTRLGDTLRVHKEHRKDSLRAEAMSFAAYRCLTDLFPLAPQTALFRQLMTTLGYDVSRYGGSRSQLRLDQLSIGLQTAVQTWGTPQPMRERRDRTSAGNPG